jgi:pimeloyl-ACP methyl ester carboxylesterase
MVVQRLLNDAGRDDVPDGLVSPAGDGFEARADWTNLQSPETYLGYEQGVNFASPGPVELDRPDTYAAPESLELNEWALSGDWTIERAVVAGFDWGARSADIVAVLWPERCSGLVSVSGYLIGNQEAGKQPLPPEAELQWWYQYYFATERGRAGYDKNRREFAKLIWRTASPQWDFDDATFDRSAASFDNPDHVAIVIHNYRWRLGLAEGEAEYDELEQRLAEAPVVTVPSITLEGDANGAPHPDPSAYANKFSGSYSHRTIEGGVGHNLPQEAPGAFAEAVLDVGGM